MNIVYPFFVDFARPQRTNELRTMQLDNKTRIARFILMNDGSPLDISEIDSISINAVLPNSQRITDDTATLAVDEDGDPINEIWYEIPVSMTSAIGKTVLTITLYKAADEQTGEEAKELHSFEFYVNTRNELNQDDGEEEDDLAGLRDLLERAAEAIAAVEQMTRQTALPNPFPLRVNLENRQYNYNGSTMVTIDLGTIISRLQAIEQAFPDGCSRIAQAVTNNGVTTSPTAGVTTIVNNIGQIRSDGNATADKILVNYNAWVGKQKINGSMPNRGGVTPAALAAGGSYTIPAGYHDGTGVVSAKSLASQTDASATAARIQKNYTAWVNGVKITGNMNDYSQGNNIADSHSVATIQKGASGTYTDAKVNFNGYAVAATRINAKPAYDAGYDEGYDAGYEAGLIAGAAGVSLSKNFTLSGSCENESGTKVNANTHVSLTISVNGSNISGRVNSGSISASAAHWIGDSYSQDPVSASGTVYIS